MPYLLRFDCLTNMPTVRSDHSLGTIPIKLSSSTVDNMSNIERKIHKSRIQAAKMIQRRPKIIELKFDGSEH